jgi:hypothetical protein
MFPVSSWYFTNFFLIKSKTSIANLLPLFGQRKFGNKKKDS